MDIMLDSSNNSLVWEDGDLKLVDGLQLIKQHILTALYTLKGDWLLDDSKGVDFPRGMRENSFLIHDIKKQISEVDGVNKIKSFEMIKDGTKITINAHILTDMGTIELNEVANQ